MRVEIIPREQAALHLSVSPAVLIRYEALGLITVTRDGGVEGYQPSEIKRIWSIVSYQRDMGVNLAGVEAILKLREHIDRLHHELEHFSMDLGAVLDQRDARDAAPDEE